MGISNTHFRGGNSIPVQSGYLSNLRGASKSIENNLTIWQNLPSEILERFAYLFLTVMKETIISGTYK